MQDSVGRSAKLGLDSEAGWHQADAVGGRPGRRDIYEGNISMKKKLIATAAIVLAVGGGALAAAPANAATFTGWSGTSYSGTQLVSSSTTANTTVDIADNQLSSGKNAQGRRWCAVNQEAGTSQIRFIFAPNTNTTTLGQYNKTTDFLWAGTAGGCS